MKVWTVEQYIFFLQEINRGYSSGLPLLYGGTHAFFPLPPQLENAADILIGKNKDAPRPSKSTLTVHGIVLVRMHTAGSEGKKKKKNSYWGV